MSILHAVTDSRRDGFTEPSSCVADNEDTLLLPSTIDSTVMTPGASRQEIAQLSLVGNCVRSSW